LKEILLTHGQVALIDDADFDWLNKWKWRAKQNPITKGFYALRKSESRPSAKGSFDISMHRQILGLKRNDGKIVKHRNKLTLDNRRINLIIRQQLPTRNNKKICGIYKITNPKSKIYIGQAKDCNKRKNHYQVGHCEKQIKLFNSIKKYGWENHKFEIIKRCNKDKLNDLEIYYIKLYNSFNTHQGLNLKTGGQYGSGIIKWTKKECKKSAKSFEYISQWKRTYSAAYQTARINGWLNECCSHMKKKFHKYNGKSYNEMFAHIKSMKENNNWKRRRDWRDKDEASYDYAVKMGFKDRIVEELNLIALKMRTDYQLINIGQLYDSPREWEDKDRQSFRVAERRRLINAFKHMKDFKGFTNKGYVVKVFNKDKTVIPKE